jgi:hypothetical protein
MVDGALEAGQAHGRTISIQLRRTAGRGFPALEPQCEPVDATEWRRNHVAAEQRTASQGGAAEEQEHIQETVHSLCCSEAPKSSRRSTRDREEDGRKFVGCEWQSPGNTQAILIDEEILD